MSSTSSEWSTAPADWRAEILDRVLRFVFVFGLVAGAVSSGYAAYVGEPSIAIADSLAVVLLAALTFGRRFTYRQRSVGFLAMLFSLGVFLIFEVGVAAHIYLIGFSVFAAVLLGLRAGLVSVAINTITLVTLALATETGPTVAMGDLGATGSRLVVVVNFVFASAVLVFTCATLLQRVERALEEQQAARVESQRLARAVEQSTDVILLADPSGRIEYANHAYTSLVERLGETARFDHLDQLAPVPLDGPSPTAIARRDGAWADVLVLPDRADGGDSYVEFDVAIDAVIGDDGDVANLVASLYDVTSIRQLERRLRRSEQLESLGTLASGVAHDFNNIVTGILGIADGLRLELQDEAQRRDVELIVDACGRARSVVQQMMVLGRRSPIDQVPIVVADAVRDARRLLRSAIGADVEIREDLRSQHAVMAHPDSITQALINLVSNAAQAMPDGGGTVTIEVADVVADDELVAAHPTLRPGAPHVVLSVTDDGTGIEPANLERIFDPFFTTKQPGEGTGLGLASVYAIVTAAQGEIGVTSEVGVGTTFRIWLPIATADKSERPTGTAADATGGHGRSLLVLVVDDEPLIVTMISRALVRAGHEVELASDGLEARDRFDADPHHIDALVTDLTMPGLGGIDLIRHVHAHRPDLPVILTSGFAHDRGDESLASLALTAYLVKPFSQADLLAALEQV